MLDAAGEAPAAIAERTTKPTAATPSFKRLSDSTTMLKLFHTQLWTGLINSFGWGSAAAAVLAFAILFVPSFLLVKLLARQIGGKTRRHAMLGPFDRVLGAGFGMLKGLLGVTLFFLLANLATDMKGEHPRFGHQDRPATA